MPYSDPDRQRQFNREWKAARRAAWLAEHGPCVDCGTWDELEVDHVDASTKVTHNVWSWAKARREAELAKCVPRCQPCHLTKSRMAGDLSLPGLRNGKVKLTEDQVREIRDSVQAARTLAGLYGISHAQMWRIKKRLKWAHLE